MVVGVLLLGLIFWRVGGGNPIWAITAFVLVYDPDMKAALASGMNRLVQNLVGAVIAVMAVLLFDAHRWVLPVTLALSVLYCGFVLKFKDGWRALMVTVTLIIGSTLLAPHTELQLALMRAVEVASGGLLAVLLAWPYSWLLRR